MTAYTAATSNCLWATNLVGVGTFVLLSELRGKYHYTGMWGMKRFNRRSAGKFGSNCCWERKDMRVMMSLSYRVLVFLIYWEEKGELWLWEAKKQYLLRNLLRVCLLVQNVDIFSVIQDLIKRNVIVHLTTCEKV